MSKFALVSSSPGSFLRIPFTCNVRESEHPDRGRLRRHSLGSVPNTLAWSKTYTDSCQVALDPGSKKPESVIVNRILFRPLPIAVLSSD